MAFMLVLSPIRADRVFVDDNRAVGSRVHRGVALNELTDIADRDPIAGTPWHKHVPVRIERVGVPVEVAR